MTDKKTFLSVRMKIQMILKLWDRKSACVP